MERKTHFNIWYWLIALSLLFWLQGQWLQGRRLEPIPYSEFQKLLQEGAISEIVIGTSTIRGELNRPLPDGGNRFVTTRVDPELARQLDATGVRYSQVIENTYLRDLLSWIVPTALLLVIWVFLLRRLTERGGLGGNFMAIGKSKARVYVETDINVGFDQVAGIEEAKEELREIVNFLKNPRAYGRLGARIPKGVLLVGPPGTGKTLLARAVAGEAGVPFFSISGSEFVEMFVGVGAARVRDLFEQARLKAPAIIFIDELDALGRARGAFGFGGHDEKEQTLNQLLAEMDGFDTSAGLVLLAATNRPEILDPALLRAGRFDRQVLVDRPDRRGRAQILAVHSRKIRMAADVALDQVAALTPGFSGADLANLVNEAALLATRRNATEVQLDDFTQAIERIVAGLEKRNRVLNAEERKVIAYHEMGHALVAMSIAGADPIHKISIIPRGIGALGYTIQRPTEDRYLMSEPELRNKMAVLLGGRAAEVLVFQRLSTGAADDLAKVTDIARSMVLRFGMVAKLGHVVYEAERPRYLDFPGVTPAVRDYSDDTAREIDCAVRELVDGAFAQATEVLNGRRALLDEWAGKLLASETLTAEELQPLRERLAGP